MPATLPWSSAWRIARRELSARFRGLRLLIICLFLGVGALAAIGSLTGAIQHGLASRGRAILGGDVEAEVWQRGLAAGEQAALRVYGLVSTGTRMQAMLSAGDATAPVELKAVDARWPMVGRLRLADGRMVGAPAADQAWLAEGAAERLGVKPGDNVSLAGLPLRVGGIIADEPDRLSEGFALGPTVIVAADVPDRAGLTAPGAMYRSKIRVACARPCDAGAVAAKLAARFPVAGLQIRTRDNAAPGAENFIARLGDFLVMVGLAALLIAGIGIGGGTASYLEARRGGIATLKVLGATGGDIARIYLLQIGMAALVGAAAGLVAGVAAMPLLAHFIGTLLPIDGGLVLDPAALARAAAYGLLVALVFAAPALAAARDFPAMALFRARVDGARLPPITALRPVVVGIGAILTLALLGSPSPAMAATFLGGAAGLVALLGLLGWVIRHMAARLPRPRGAVLRMALANLYRPGAQTGRLVTALGFGLSAFVLLAVVETSLSANIAARVPQRAPDYFVLDLAPDQLPAFTALVQRAAPASRIRAVPALRGAILAYGPAAHMTRVADLAAIPDNAWALRGERGLTYSDDVPEGNAVTEGQWWPRNYSGPPLVSVDQKFADAVGLHIGDRLTIGLLGVERSATVAAFRRIDWDSFGFNYVLVFSPNTLADAPHKLAVTIALPRKNTNPNRTGHGALLRGLTRAFPSISVIEVGSLLRAASALLDQMSTAILAAASVAVLAGIAVLLGAIAAARASRLYDNVILRVLGASRSQLLALQLAEFGALALVLAGVALALGSGLGWLVMVKLFAFDFLPDWPRVLAVLGGGLLLVLVFAVGGSLPLLRARPAEALREL
ncbi:MAG: ABC transporter permease [Pseudomonadota bacterium]|nr:ABC transporter permease [Pseudomonadota bacterium]